MIQINLLDESGRKRRKGRMGRGAAATGGNDGSKLIGLVVILMLGVNGYFGWAAFSTIHQSGGEYRALRDENASVKKEIDDKLNTADQIRQYREVLSNQMDVLRSLDPPDRILWCEKINMLSSLMPPNVFLAEIKIDEDIEMVETRASREARDKWKRSKDADKGREPNPVKRPVIKYIMRLTGLALGDDSVRQMDNAMKMHEEMTRYAYVDHQGVKRRFMTGFAPDIDFESFEVTTYEGESVTKFIFKLTTLPLGGEQGETDTGVQLAMNRSNE